MPINTCCCGTSSTCIAPGSFICPSGLASSYNVSCPTAISSGTCPALTGACTSSVSSTTVNLAASCDWTNSSVCVAGYNADVELVGGTNGNYINCNSTCSAWMVAFAIALAAPPFQVKFIYAKQYLGSSDTPIGTYNFCYALLGWPGPTTNCPGATADATITVS